jgi:hypothetical protein
MPASEECNKGTSTADLAVALISRWGDAGTAQEQLDHAKFAKRALVRAPSLRDEWLSIVDDPAASRRAREHLFRHGVRDRPSACFACHTWTSNGRAAEPVRSQRSLQFISITSGEDYHPKAECSRPGERKKILLATGIPQIFSDMFGGYGAIAQGKWDERKTFEYRFRNKTQDALFGCLARFRRGFFVWGFTMNGPELLPQTQSIEWIKPSEMLSLVNTRRHKI